MTQVFTHSSGSSLNFSSASPQIITLPALLILSSSGFFCGIIRSSAYPSMPFLFPSLIPFFPCPLYRRHLWPLRPAILTPNTYITPDRLRFYNPILKIPISTKGTWQKVFEFYHFFSPKILDLAPLLNPRRYTRLCKLP